MSGQRGGYLVSEVGVWSGRWMSGRGVSGQRAVCGQGGVWLGVSLL